MILYRILIEKILGRKMVETLWKEKSDVRSKNKLGSGTNVRLNVGDNFKLSPTLEFI